MFSNKISINLLYRANIMPLNYNCSSRYGNQNISIYILKCEYSLLTIAYLFSVNQKMYYKYQQYYTRNNISCRKCFTIFSYRNYFLVIFISNHKWSFVCNLKSHKITYTGKCNIQEFRNDKSFIAIQQIVLQLQGNDFQIRYTSNKISGIIMKMCSKYIYNHIMLFFFVDIVIPQHYIIILDRHNIIRYNRMF